jgi:CRP-like cAMP-binding protein
MSGDMSGDRAPRRNAVEREIFLRSMALGRPPSRDNRQMGEAMREEFFPAGTVIYRVGDPSDEIYFVVRGTISLTKEGTVTRNLDARSVVGILDAIRERPHDRTATALTDVEALVLRDEDRLEMLEDSFEYTRDIILFSLIGLHELMLELPDMGLAEPGESSPPVEPPEPDPLPMIERVLTLRDAPAFGRASIQPLVSLAQLATEVRVRAGEMLFRAGEVTGVFFVVARGCVELERSDPPGLARFGPAAIVGGIPALGDAERIYSARAVGDSVLLCFRESDFFDVLEDHFELARSVLAFIADQRVAIVDEIERRKAQLGASVTPR